MVAGRAEVLGHRSSGHVRRLGRRSVCRAHRAGHTCGDLARDRADLPLQVAYPGLARVITDNPPDRIVIEYDLLRVEPVILELARNQIAADDVQLFTFAVAAERDDLHAIEQRRMD